MRFYAFQSSIQGVTVEAVQVFKFSNMALQISSACVAGGAENGIRVFLMVWWMHFVHNVIVEYAYGARYGAFFQVAELNEFRSFSIELGTTSRCRISG